MNGLLQQMCKEEDVGFVALSVSHVKKEELGMRDGRCHGPGVVPCQE